MLYVEFPYRQRGSLSLSYDKVKLYIQRKQAPFRRALSQAASPAALGLSPHPLALEHAYPTEGELR